MSKAYFLELCACRPVGGRLLTSRSQLNLENFAHQHTWNILIALALSIIVDFFQKIHDFSGQLRGRWGTEWDWKASIFQTLCPDQAVVIFHWVPDTLLISRSHTETWIFCASTYLKYFDFCRLIDHYWFFQKIYDFPGPLRRRWGDRMELQGIYFSNFVPRPGGRYFSLSSWYPINFPVP